MPLFGDTIYRSTQIWSLWTRHIELKRKRAVRVDCNRLTQNHFQYSMKWCRRHKWYQVKYQWPCFGKATCITLAALPILIPIQSQAAKWFWVRASHFEYGRVSSLVTNTCDFIPHLGAVHQLPRVVWSFSSIFPIQRYSTIQFIVWWKKNRWLSIPE